MSTQQALVAARREVPMRVPPRLPTTVRRMPWWTRPGWPLALMFVGFPLWWILGVVEPVTVFAAVAMAYELIHRRSIAVPHGFGIWLLFLAWVAVGFVVVQVDAPGAVAGVNQARYLTWAFRLLWYLKATIVLLYIGNMRTRLPLARVARIFGWMFVWIVLGGLLGSLKPGLDFPSVLEVILPHRLTSIEFIRSLIHPNLAEYVNILGVSTARSSAPFAYTNVWGLNFVCFLPFFLCSWLARDAGWRRWVAPFVLIVGIVPVIDSLNRGMWAALSVCALFLAVRSALAGNLRVLGGLVAGAVAVAALIAVTPLGGSLQARFQNPNSNEGRAQLASLGFDSVVDRSPIVGFGSTRYVQGNFDSIAGGASPSCPRCVLPSLGTQGQLSLVVFCQGLAGAMLYLAFMMLQFLRHIRLRSPYATVGLSVLLMHFVTISIYSVDNLALIPLFVAIGLLWRVSSDDERDRRQDRDLGHTGVQTLADYRRFLRHSRALIMVAVLVGSMAGAGWQIHRGSTVTSTVSLLLPAEPEYPGTHIAPTTLDTFSQLVESRSVQEAIRANTTPAQWANGHLSVTADSNTRILNLSYTGPDGTAATAAVQAAADALLAEQQNELEQLRAETLATQREQGAQLVAAVNTVDQALSALRDNAGLESEVEVAILHGRHDDLVRQLRAANTVEQQVSTTPLNAGQVVSAPFQQPARHVWAVPVSSGAALGLLAGLLLAMLRGHRATRIRRLDRLAAATSLPVRRHQLPDLDALRDHRPTVYLGIGRDRAACRAAAELDAALQSAVVAGVSLDLDDAATNGARRPGERVVLVASSGTRIRAIAQEQASLAALGLETVGVVLVDA